MKDFNGVIDFLSKNINEAVEKCGLDLNGQKNVVSFSNRPDIADFQTNICFALAKQKGVNPKVLAEELQSNLSATVLEYFNVEVCPPAFINFSFNEKGVTYFLNEISKNEYFGLEKIGDGKTVVLDYGGANIAKELHMGHLRSPIIGESLTRLYKFFGYKTVGDVHLGDWGLQMGLVMAILDEIGKLEFYYTGKGEKPEITLEFLNENYPKASAKSKTDPEFKKKAETFTLNLQQLKEPYFTIWKDIKEVSIKAIERNYNNLNCKFDLWYGESDAQKYIDRTIKLFVDKGLAYESEEALVVDVKKEGEHIPIPKKDPSEKQLYKNPMPPVIIKKHNGGDLYATTDLATLIQRVEDNKNLTEVVYITDKRQAGHFEGVFRASRLAEIVPEEIKLTHIGYGTMNGRDGKPFKTRDGGVIKLEDVIDMVTNKASEKLKANGVESDHNLAQIIGVGAMKFGDLSNEISRDYVFDLDAFMSFEGKTGPYLQYTAVRISSLLSKAGEFTDKIVVADEYSKEILVNILKLNESLELAHKNLCPSFICTSVYNLASSYSRMYNNVRMLSEQDKVKRDSYLSLSKLVYKKICLALDLLAISVPEKM